jgi:hypothetical protein
VLIYARSLDLDKTDRKLCCSLMISQHAICLSHLPHMMPFDMCNVGRQNQITLAHKLSMTNISCLQYHHVPSPVDTPIDFRPGAFAGCPGAQAKGASTILRIKGHLQRKCAPRCMQNTSLLIHDIRTTNKHSSTRPCFSSVQHYDVNVRSLHRRL